MYISKADMLQEKKQQNIKLQTVWPTHICPAETSP